MNAPLSPTNKDLGQASISEGFGHVIGPSIGDRLLEISERLRGHVLNQHRRNLLSGIYGEMQLDHTVTQDVREILSCIENHQLSLPEFEGLPTTEVFLNNLVQGIPVTIVSKIYGTTEAQVTAAIRASFSFIRQTLGISRSALMEQISVWRAEKLAEPFASWMQTYAAWVTHGGEPPARTIINLSDANTYFSHIAFLDALELPWRKIARDTPQGYLEALRYPDKNDEKVPQAYCLAVYSPEGELRNMFLMADAQKNFFKFKIDNPRTFYGPSGQFYALLRGEGPVCLKTAFAPRDLTEETAKDGAGKGLTAYLLPTDAKDVVAHRFYVPVEYAGSQISPHLPVGTLKAGEPVNHFCIYPASNNVLAPDPTTILAEYEVQRDSGKMRIRRISNLGDLASWDNSLSAELIDKARCWSWLSNEIDSVPRLEAVTVRSSPIFMKGIKTDRIRKYILFSKEKIGIPLGCQSQELHPRCFEYGNKRLVGFWENPDHLHRVPPVIAIYCSDERLYKLDFTKLLSKWYPKDKATTLKIYG